MLDLTVLRIMASNSFALCCVLSKLIDYILLFYISVISQSNNSKESPILTDTSINDSGSSEASTDVSGGSDDASGGGSVVTIILAVMVAVLVVAVVGMVVKMRKMKNCK